MAVLIDDVGSFPLPREMDRKSFDKAYMLAREAIIRGNDVKEDDFLLKNFYRIIFNSFTRKIRTGLDVVNYPQHFDMHNQFVDLIHKAMDEGTYIVDSNQAVIPELHVIMREAKRLYERIGEKVHLRVSITGPLELYWKEVGVKPYEDILFMFAETVKNFAINSIVDSKYVKTEVVTLDEPSFGFQMMNLQKDLVVKVFEKSFNFNGALKNIHLHSPARISDLLTIENLDLVSIEYAASPQNIKQISKKMLNQADKQIRLGISRTDIDSITAELYDRGIIKPTVEQIVEDKKTIEKRFHFCREKYGETMTFVGPDCGLGGWPTQEAAELLLNRTVTAVKSKKKL
ncbi:MAG: hypothetical protein PVH12_05435 [Candidatus Bathyarchaeota archaeon]|jgi:5-methyltetrahydropteroyltriglutamate--homocysteine methyltransferase